MLVNMIHGGECVDEIGERFLTYYKVPPSAGRLSKRLVKNVDYFQVDPEITFNADLIHTLFAFKILFFVSISPDPPHL